jgi:hypothetical protein
MEAEVMKWAAKIMDVFSGGLLEGIGKLATKFKMPPEQKMRFQIELEDTFRQFVVEYEGRASDIGPFWRGVRTSVRPVLTYGITGSYVTMKLWLLFATMTPEMHELVAANSGEMKAATLVVLIFWFGDKALQRTGLIDALKTKWKNGK